jgi:predicted O-methyltransferase YrrM
MDALDMETGLGGDNVAVDQCHLDLVYGLIVSHKPKSVLELGVGSGRTTRTIIRATDNNEDKPAITLVDSWADFGGKVPECIENYKKFCKVVTSEERDFVFSTRDAYDFIFSDADHWNADKWFDYVYDRLLSPNGILVYHDVSTGPLPNNELRFPNLTNILYKCKARGLSHVHLDRCSKKGEKCYRGLLVIFKSQLQRVVPLGTELGLVD